MAIATLVATSGAANANSYCTIAEADQYDDNRPAAASADTWTNASTTEKTEALLWAAILIEAFFTWTGTAVNSTQNLSWPRNGMYTVRNYVITNTTIPQELKNAQAEFARQLLVEDRAGDDDLDTLGIKRLKASVVELEFSGKPNKILPDAAFLLIPESWYSNVRGRASAFTKLTRA